MKEDTLAILTDLKEKVARLDDLHFEIERLKKTAPAWYNKVAPLILLGIEGWFIYKYLSLHVVLMVLGCLLLFAGWFLVFKVIIGDVILSKLNKSIIEQKKTEYDELLTSAEQNKLIPSRYFNSEYLAFIEEPIRYDRADSMKEALQMLDEKLQNEEFAEKVAELSHQQEITNRQLRKATSQLNEIKNNSYYDHN